MGKSGGGGVHGTAADQDDLAATFGAHVRQHGAYGAKRTPEIDVELVLDFGFAAVLKKSVN